MKGAGFWSRTSTAKPLRDALAYVETCRARGVPAALERSRSGNGGHVWIFFSERVLARDARQLGALLVTATMERRPEIGFASYDRFFPSQDTLPLGGFGNLIALPLQRGPREHGNSVFVDDQLRPYDDQWAFLSALPRMTRDAVSVLIAEAQRNGSVLGVRMPVDDEDADQPWLLPPSRQRRLEAVTGSLPSQVDIVLADGIYVDRSTLPSAMVTRLARLAAFQNPEFYRAQAMRLSTFGKPRIVSCAELNPRHIALPRGCLDEAVDMLQSHGIKTRVDDRREGGTLLPVKFLGTLREEQIVSFEALSAHECGVLAATPAFGKTVVATALIAHRACNSLVLVHRRELLTQWVERLKTFLSVESSDIGTIGAGRRKPTGRIDVAVIQSLVREGEVSDLIGGYGQLIVDACHISRPRVSSLWHAGRRPDTCLAFRRPWRGEMATSRSSSCSAARFGFASAPSHRRRGGASSIVSCCAKPLFVLRRTRMLGDFRCL
jgi:hypothetical protein